MNKVISMLETISNNDFRQSKIRSELIRLEEKASLLYQKTKDEKFKLSQYILDNDFPDTFAVVVAGMSYHVSYEPNTGMYTINSAFIANGND